MKVFISQPINGKSYEDVIKVCEVARNKLQALFPGEEISIIESFIPTMYFHKNNPIDNSVVRLGTYIGLMGDADLVYMCKGWEKSRDCSIARRVAIDYEIPYMYESYEP